MSTYGSTASIFQLAFGLNAVLPTVYFAYRRAHDAVAKRLAEEINNIDPSITFKEREMIVVRHYVRYGFPGMRLSRHLGIFVAGLFSVSVLVSFLGLLASSIKTDAPLANWVVLLFSTFTLFLCPVVGILYDQWLWLFERQVILRMDRATALSFLDPIKDSLVFEELGRHMNEITRSAQEISAKMGEEHAKRELLDAWHDFKGKYVKVYDRLSRWFRA